MNQAKLKAPLKDCNINTAKKNLYIGIFWKIASCFCFAAVNGLVRYLSGGSAIEIDQPLPVYTIMFLQNAIGTIMILPLITFNKAALDRVLHTKHPVLHTVRVVTATLGIGLWYLSLQFIPLAQVVALSFAAPFIAILGAVIFLHETLNLQRMIAVILSMVGGFLIARPDLGLQNASHIGWLAIFPLLATLIFAGDKLITRKLLSNGESAAVLTLLLIAGTAGLCLLPTLYYGWHSPSAASWPWLLLLGLVGMLAHFTFSKAFSYAEVTVLLPFAVTKIVFCGIIGYVVFSEIPKTFDMWVGVIITTLSALILNYEKKPLPTALPNK